MTEPEFRGGEFYRAAGLQLVAGPIPNPHPPTGMVRVCGRVWRGCADFGSIEALLCGLEPFGRNRLDGVGSA